MSKGTPKQLPKVLIVAEHASQTFGGEALIPFNYFKYLREMNADVHLLVHQRTQVELRAAFPKDLSRLHFVADSLVNIWCHKIATLMPERLGEFTVGAVSHIETQIRQRRLARSLVQKHGFDVVHEPIPVSPKIPSMMFGLSAPVIIGPMNGGMDYPPNYNLAGPFERFVIAGLGLSAALWNTIFPGKRYAALLLVANKRTYDALPNALKGKPIMEFVENGVDLDLFRSKSAHEGQGNFRIIYIGRLVNWKRVDLLIDACAQLIGSVELEFDLVGDGPMRTALEDQVRRRSLTDKVHFHGSLSHSAIADLLRRADVMVLPSMRECGGAVVLEAMASGLPVIATKWGGPTDYITADTGVLVPPATPEVFVTELANAMLTMAKSADGRAEMGAAGRRRVEAHYDWRVKARAFMRIYQQVAHGKSITAESAGVTFP